MAQTFAGLAAVLVNDRTERQIYNLMQNDIAAWNKMPSKKRSFPGDVTIIGARVTRNGSVKSTLTSTEPTAGQQGFIRYTVQVGRMIGRAEFDEFTQLSADSEAGSLAVEPMDEIDNLINDFNRKMTKFVFQGGGALQGLSGLAIGGAPIGFVWQRSNAITTYGYRGRSDDIVAQAQAVNFARFIRLDTYAQVGADTLITDLTSSTITLAANIDTSALGNVPCAVILVGAASQAFNDATITGTNTTGDPCAFAVPGPNTETIGALIGDMTGIIANLSNPIHFGNDRSATTPAMRRLRPNFQICNNTNAQGGAVLDGSELDKLAATVRTSSGRKADAWWMSFITQVTYPQSLYGTNDANMRVNAQDGSKPLDGAAPVNKGNDDSFSNTGRGGVPIHCSDMCPDGVAFALHYDDWERLFKGKIEGQWVGANGPGTSPLVKLQGQAGWGATRTMYPQMINIYPKSTGCLIGIADPA